MPRLSTSFAPTLRRWLTGVALLAAGAASAQVSYGGYNLGPDYGAMIQQQQAQQQLMNQRMQQQQNAIVQQAMQNPDCQAKYRQHLAQGGRLSYEQFAYQYVATGGFSSEGLARYRQSEQQSQQREAAAWQGVRQAEAARGQAQQQYADGYRRNQAEAGEVLRGNSSWVDPTTGQQRALPYLGPNGGYTDPRTGQRYWRDANGQYFVQAGNGGWYPMNPAR